MADDEWIRRQVLDYNSHVTLRKVLCEHEVTTINPYLLRNLNNFKNVELLLDHLYCTLSSIEIADSNINRTILSQLCHVIIQHSDMDTIYQLCNKLRNTTLFTFMIYEAFDLNRQDIITCIAKCMFGMDLRVNTRYTFMSLLSIYSHCNDGNVHRKYIDAFLLAIKNIIDEPFMHYYYCIIRNQHCDNDIVEQILICFITKYHNMMPLPDDLRSYINHMIYDILNYIRPVKLVEAVIEVGKSYGITPNFTRFIYLIASNTIGLTELKYALDIIDVNDPPIMNGCTSSCVRLHPAKVKMLMHHPLVREIRPRSYAATQELLNNGGHVNNYWSPFLIDQRSKRVRYFRNYVNDNLSIGLIGYDILLTEIMISYIGYDLEGINVKHDNCIIPYESKMSDL